MCKDLQRCSGLYLHLLVCPGDFVTEEYLEVFVEIGHYAGGNTRVIRALLTALQKIMELAAPLNIQEYQDLLTEIISTLAAKSMVEGSVVSSNNQRMR